ncbi:MAG: N-acetyltransferase [Chloroflexi bacterium]|nr:MAG: N-acetyltransferase [Chloroflexota bacterium]
MATVAPRNLRLERTVRVHATAEVAETAELAPGVQVWHQAQIREGAVLGENCIIGKGAYIDAGVSVGRNCKIQNYALVYSGTTLGDGVFIGPSAILTNDRYPRAITPDGELKRANDWEPGTIEVGTGASIGAGAVIVTGIRIGAFAMIGAGSVVTHDVPAHALMIGSPAFLAGWVCRCGRPLTKDLPCFNCGETLEGVRS